LSKGKPPKLKALAMHNGNIYKWNRLCYGVSDGKPHLRIENRYIPTGPTLIDEVANIAFWVGIMKAMPEEFKDLPEKMDFRSSRQNFYKAAKHGLNTQFDWMGKRISAKALLLTEMLPLAKKGLESVGIAEDEISKYLNIVEQRIKKNKTGSQWMSTNFNRLKQKFTKRRTAFFLTQQMLKYQEKDIPVHEWRNIKISKKPSQLSDFTVSDVMTTDLIVVNENDPILILQHLMKWNNIHEILVENNDHKLTGIVSIDKHIKLFNKTNKSRSVKTIMNKDVKTISPDVELVKAKEMMKKYKLTAIPVIFDDKLIGIVTNKHFKQFSIDV
jgi:CBS domain-containing protein